MHSTVKRWGGFPCAHRQHQHDGHCKFLHGYDLHFEAVFESETVDSLGFVVDFGKLKPVKELLQKTFDHALMIQDGDPEIKTFEHLDRVGACKLRVWPCISMECRAKWLFDQLTVMGLPVVQTSVYENERNGASYDRD